MKFCTGLRVSVFVVFGLSAIACDPSKPELDKTRQQLQQVTAERDNLKSQVEASDAKISSLQQQLTSLQAAATAKPEPTDPNAGAAGKKGKKHGAHAKAARHKRR